MAPNERQRSGEWPPQHPTPLPTPQFVTVDHFNNFTEECRGFFGEMRETMTEVGKQMAQGSTRFALMDSDMKRQIRRSDEHSGQIKVLLDDKTIRTAIENTVAEQQKPRRDIGLEIVKSLIIAGVLGIAAVIYNAWRDQEVARSTTSTTISTSTSVPVKPLPAPATTPP